MRKLVLNAVLALAVLSGCLNGSAAVDVGDAPRVSFAERVAHCTRSVTPKYKVGETKDLLGEPLDGFQLWRVGRAGRDVSVYEIRDNSGTCLFAFLDYNRRIRHDGSEFLSEPEIFHGAGLTVLLVPSEEIAPDVIIDGYTYANYGLENDTAEKEIGAIYDRCRQTKTREICRTETIDFGLKKTSQLSVSDGSVVIFGAKVFFDGDFIFDLQRR